MAKQHGITASTYDNIMIDAGAVYKNYGIASRTITCASVIATDAVTVAATVNGVNTTKTFACVASDATGDQFNIGESDSLTATALAEKIDAMDGITASADGAVITVAGESVAVLLTITTSDTTFTLASNGLNTTFLGATRGGNKFEWKSEYKDMEVDGAAGPVKGARRITKFAASITANFIEVSSDLIKLALPGSAYTSDSTHDTIRRSLDLALTDYNANIVIVGNVNGKTYPVIIGVENALADGGFSLDFKDKDEGAVAVTFTAHFSSSDLSSEPCFISYPKS